MSASTPRAIASVRVGAARSLRAALLRRLRHAPAFVRTPPARGRAGLAMVHAVLRAFFAAGIAKLRTKLAGRGGMLAVAGHHAGGESTGGGAIHVEGDAAGHRLGIG